MRNVIMQNETYDMAIYNKFVISGHGRSLSFMKNFNYRCCRIKEKQHDSMYFHTEIIQFFAIAFLLNCYIDLFIHGKLKGDQKCGSLPGETKSESTKTDTAVAILFGSVYTTYIGNVKWNIPDLHYIMSLFARWYQALLRILLSVLEVE